MTALRVLSILRYVLVAAIAVVLAVPVLITPLTGRQILVVEGGSMRPAYEIGDLVVVAPPGDAPPRVGEVVTARRPDGVLYTHRIVAVDGDTATTQGDANPVADTQPLTRAATVGTVVLHLGAPWAALLRASESLPGRISLAAIVVGLILIPLVVRRPRSGDLPVGVRQPVHVVDPPPLAQQTRRQYRDAPGAGARGGDRSPQG
jgi:signal peptidase I